MNPWRRGPVTTNPYARTAFRVAGVSRDVVRHRSLVQRLAETRNVIHSDPAAHVIGCRPVTPEEINAAEEVLLDPKRRVTEELFHHAREELAVAPLRELIRRCEETVASDARSLEQGRCAALKSLATHLQGLYLEQAGGADPFLGALETGLVPPFGPTEDS